MDRGRTTKVKGKVNGMPNPEWDRKLKLSNGKPNLNRTGFYKNLSDKLGKTIPKALSGPNKPKTAICAPYQDWYWEKLLTLKSPDKMNQTGNAGILHP